MCMRCTHSMSHIKLHQVNPNISTYTLYFSILEIVCYNKFYLGTEQLNCTANCCTANFIDSYKSMKLAVQQTYDQSGNTELH